MGSSSKFTITTDWQRFDPWRVSTVRHNFHVHPLLQPTALGALASRLDDRGLIRTHSSKAGAGTPFNDAPALHPNRSTAAETFKKIGDIGAWMSLLNVQADDVYRKLVDEALDPVADLLALTDPGLSYRGGWIFVTSPRTVTPFHIDREHNFILQVRGRKTLYVWEPDDLDAVSDAARNRFHRSHDRSLIHWREELRKSAHVISVEPGMGAYMPSTSPHMVESGDDPSITISFTYYTNATRNRHRAHCAQDFLPYLGMAPSSASLGHARAALGSAVAATDNLKRLLTGKARRVDGSRYALPDVY